MSQEKKVLIACPLGDGKEYSINEWFEYIARQTHKNFDICVCVNGRSEQSIRKKVALLEMVEITLEGTDQVKKIDVIRLPYNPYDTVKQRLFRSREKIRQYATNRDYDYIMWLDSDTIPLRLDAIERLVDHKVDAVSGLYFYKETQVPVLIDPDTKTNPSIKKMELWAEKNELAEVWGWGFGVALISRKVFEKTPFDYEKRREDWTEDFAYCELMEEANIKRYFDPHAICKHYHKKEFTVQDNDDTQ